MLGTFERVVEGAVAALSELSDEQINRSSGAVHANAMYSVATHLVAMGEFWVLGLVGGGSVKPTVRQSFGPPVSAQI